MKYYEHYKPTNPEADEQTLLEEFTALYEQRSKTLRAVLNYYGIGFTQPTFKVVKGNPDKHVHAIVTYGERPLSKHAQALWDELVEQLMSENIE